MRITLEQFSSLFLLLAAAATESDQRMSPISRIEALVLGMRAEAFESLAEKHMLIHVRGASKQDFQRDHSKAMWTDLWSQVRAHNQVERMLRMKLDDL